MRRQDEEQMHTPFLPEEDITLESILAEYGKGGRQPAQTEEAPESVPMPVPDPEPVPASAPEPMPEPVSEPEPEQEEEITIRPPRPERTHKKRKPRKKQDTTEFPVIRTKSAPPPKPKPEPEPEKAEEDDLPPDRVSLKNVMHDTVDAVLAENDDGILEPPPSLRERLHGLLAHRHIRRGLPQDTEQLWEEPQRRRRPEPEPEPEPDSDEAFRAEKRRAKHLSRSLTVLTFPVAVLLALAILEGLGYMPAAWTESVTLHARVPCGILLLSAMLAMDVWKYAFREVKSGHVTSALGALLLTFAVDFDGIVATAVTQDGHAPFAATAALLIWMELWALLLEAETRRDAFQLVNVGGEPPYVASSVDVGLCKQKGRLSGFYRMTDKTDPARRWQWYLTPILLSAATVLAAVVCLSGHSMERFLWVWSAHLTVALPLSLSLTAALPLQRLQYRLTRSGSALAGYAGTPALSRSRQLLITENDLFPTGTVAFNGYKVYGEERIKMLSYADGMAQAAHSQLAPLFR